MIQGRSTSSDAQSRLRDAILNGTAQYEKHEGNPIVYPNQAWEFQAPNIAHVWGSICYDPSDGKFKMWYAGVDYVLDDTLLCYAESEDGIHWRKPDLGIVEYRGSARNNIILVGKFFDLDGTVVYLDPAELDPQRRFKRLSNIAPPHSHEEMKEISMGDPAPQLLRRFYENCRVELSYSHNGIEWSEGISVMPGRCVDCGLSFLRQPDGCGFEMYARPAYIIANPPKEKRVMVRWKSRDLTTWTHEDVILRAPDWPNQQLYTMAVCRLAGTYFGFASIYNLPAAEDAQKEKEAEGSRRSDTLEVYLATSSDGDNWRWLSPERAFLPIGDPGSFDSGRIYVLQAPLVVEDKLYVYYSGLDCRHYARVRGESVHSAIGLYIVRP